MKVQSFSDVDTLYIEFRRDGITETRSLDEDMLIGVDSKGDVCALPSSTPANVPT